MPAIIKSLPIYDTFFAEGANHPSYKTLSSTDKELTSALSGLPADFSMQDKVTNWKSTSKKIALIALKVIIFPWGAYALCKYFVQRVVMIGLCPAQSRIMKFFFSNLIGTTSLAKRRLEIGAALKEKEYAVRHVSLEKNGVCYSGLLIGHKNTIHNGKWVLQATGNMEPIERHAQGFAEIYKKMKYNTLLINGPVAGSSKGHANPKSMGDAQELGLSFLETAVKAKKIVIAGRSLGGASTGQAILSHKFKDDVKYLAVSQMTFGRASDACGKVLQDACGSLIGNLVRRATKWSGCEMDHLEVSKKLQEVGIKEIVVQATKKAIPNGQLPMKEDFMHDDVIPGSATLGFHLIQEGITENKVFIGLPYSLDPMTTLFHMTNFAITSPKNHIKAL